MDTASLKEYIFKNDKVEFVLEKINCGNIKYHPAKDFYSASNYNGDNPSAINVYNDKYLMIHNWTREDEFDDMSDIISLVQYNRQCSFVDAVKYLHNILGLEYSPYKKQSKTEKKDPLSVFKNAIGRKSVVDVSEIQSIAEEATNDFVPLLYVDWFHEGITPWARDKFGLAYSYRHRRVVIPIRYWLDGSLVGFNERTTIKNYEELGVHKYFLTPTYKKSLNLYGLWENREEIERKGYVVVAESEKSVLKRYSGSRYWGEGCGEPKERYDGTCVAIQGKIMSDEQRRIILGLDIDEVVIALDNDVDINEVRHMCEKFYHIRNVSYIRDKWGLLGEKDAPMDAENKVYMFLFNHRIPYDKHEHELYVRSMAK